MHYNEIEANNEEQARARIEAMYPSDQGFVIDEFLGFVIDEFLEIGGSIE